MNVDPLTGCCGIREINELRRHRKPETALKEFKRYGNTIGTNFRYAIFSQAGRRSMYGVRFAAFIKAQNLGEVIETGTHVNPNSGNPLKVFIWTVDHDAVRRWSV